MICGVCGGSGSVLRVPLPTRTRDWFRPCTGLCEGRGIVSTAQLQANPKPNQLDWYGAFFRGARVYYDSELPVVYFQAPGVRCSTVPLQWFRGLARCVIWDSRDWYEFG